MAVDGGRSTSRLGTPSTGSTATGGTIGTMAVTTDDSHLGASVGLSDADLVEMYRLVALARAVDERMWILNRAGRIPFVISGQGHEGAQVGIAWAVPEGPRLDRAVLPLDRDLPDVRDERARHHDRAVRDGERPVVGRAADARPLRQPRAQPRLGVARRSRRSCSTRSGSRSRPRSARPARSR